jgi:hypothetical protein
VRLRARFGPAAAVMDPGTIPPAASKPSTTVLRANPNSAASARLDGNRAPAASRPSGKLHGATLLRAGTTAEYINADRAAALTAPPR